MLLVLGFNRTQVIHARQERAFFAELQSAVTRDRLSGAKFPRRYFIELPNRPRFFPSCNLRTHTHIPYWAVTSPSG